MLTPRVPTPVFGGVGEARQTFGAARLVEARHSARATAASGATLGEGPATVGGTDRGPYDASASPGSTPLPGAVADETGDNGTFQDNRTTEPTGMAPIITTTGTGPLPHQTTRPRQGFFGRAMENIRERIDRTHDLVRDLTLMLLLVVTINTFGHGSGVTVLILVWIYLAIAFFWAGMMMLIESRIIDAILGSIEMLLLLAMLVAAYSIGWIIF
ncbi:hypothetical protein BGZ83_000213 [Gryganskiella cystojenkinii]|nr:hypothetical protein BGZ83_000213 [Gryganskiella cystojenkinii]